MMLLILMKQPDGILGETANKVEQKNRKFSTLNTIALLLFKTFKHGRIRKFLREKQYIKQA